MVAVVEECPGPPEADTDVFRCPPVAATAEAEAASSREVCNREVRRTSAADPANTHLVRAPALATALNPPTASKSRKKS